ncbi:MAG TPA: BTAD domain-containing putative transcriptional regulator [Paucimonas sp.]|nr:BTAD domain-containing putative transcriptional regulator [Paucimonas sp.]
MTSTTTIGSKPEPQVRYAKLARPRLHNALPRRRLFALIDTLRGKHKVIWIASPPGAGKTTLAASYLADAETPAIWCQIDQGDSDPATLFFFLSEATKNTAQAQPWSAIPEDIGSPDVEKLFFRDFYARLPAGSIVVFDNMQEFDWNNAGRLMETALTAIPDGISVIAISRDPLPRRLAALEPAGLIGVLEWSHLRLDDGEARALAQVEDAAANELQRWLDLVDGWAAGIVMLRNLPRHSAPSATPHLEGRDAIFRYFAGEILERMPKPWQRLLLLLSCLPGISPSDAEQLTGDSSAIRLLSQLYHNRLFVERRGSSTLTYHFHALFREFLQYEAQHRLDAGERAALFERAAAILDSQGRDDEAAQLYLSAGTYSSLASLLLRRADDMLTSGRSQTWREWMSWLPPDAIDAEPWLRYWHGVSMNPVAPRLARKILTQASQIFRSQGDMRALLLTTAAIIDSYDFEWADFHALPGLIEQMTGGLRQLELSTIDPLSDLRIHSRLMLALLLAEPESPLMAATAQRVRETLPRTSNSLETLAVGAILLRYYHQADDGDAASSLMATLSGLANDTAISPLHRARWYRQVARWYNRGGHYHEAEEITGTAKRIVTSFNLDPLLYQLLEIHHLLGAGDIPQARALLEQVAQSLPPNRTLDAVELHGLEANCHALSGDISRAMDAASEAIDISISAGLPAAERARFEAFLASCHATVDDFEGAFEWFDKAAAHAHGHDAVLTREARQMVEAYALSVQGDHEGAANVLKETLGNHRERQGTTIFLTLPKLASKIAAMALKWTIEADHMRTLIARQRLVPPDRLAIDWPWAVAVHALGEFTLSLKGERIASSGKAQQRPLRLLKALLAYGDSGKSQQLLATTLWPEAEDAKSALNVTVHRLRKLLGDDNAVIVAAGKISLAHDLVWSDVTALMELCDRIDSLPAETSAYQVKCLTADLLALYRGPFCPDDEESWSLPARDRCRHRFLKAAGDLGQRLEQAGEWDTARQLYSRAIDAESLAETNYRGLMRCAHAANDLEGAAAAYRRCINTLSIVLGHRPSPETEKLAASLKII